MSTFQDMLNRFKQKRQMQQYEQDKQQLGQVISPIQRLATNPTLTGAITKTAPVANAATGALNVGNDLAKGDYANAGLNGAKTAAYIAGGPIGAAIGTGIDMLQMFNNAQKQNEAKAMQMSMQEAQNSEQANENSLQGLQNTFQNNSEQAAQNMTQPNNYQDIINKISNNLNTASGTPVNSNLGINTLEDIQTPQNGLSYIPQNEDLDLGVPTGGAAPISNMFNKYIKPIQVMDDGNGGAVIDKTATNQLIQQQGLEPKQSLLERIKQGLGEFKEGYDDNSQNGFANGDLVNQLAGNTNQPVTTDENGVLTGGAATTKKTIMNRIGEAAGTGRRLMANPWVQAGIAGLISKADGGDIGDMAQAAYKYGTAKAMSDQYYRQLNPDAKVMPVLNTYGVDDYKAKAMNDFNQGRTMISRRDMVKLNNPNMSDSDVEDVLQKAGINGDEMISLKGYDAVQKANYNQGKLKQGQQKIDNQKAYQQGQLKIKQQSVNNTKANADRNYQLKLKSTQDKVSKSNLKEQTKQELNKNLAKYSTIVNDPNRSDDDKARARQGMINAYGKDFLSVERSLYEEL